MNIEPSGQVLNDKEIELRSKIIGLYDTGEIYGTISEESRKVLSTLREEAGAAYAVKRTPIAKGIYTRINRNVNDLLNPRKVFSIPEDVLKIITSRLFVPDLFSFERVNRCAMKVAREALMPIVKEFGYDNISLFKIALKDEFNLAIECHLFPRDCCFRKKKLPFDRVLMNFHRLPNDKKMEVAQKSFKLSSFETSTVCSDPRFKILRDLFHPVVASPKPRNEIIENVVGLGTKNILTFLQREFTYQDNENAPIHFAVLQTNFYAVKHLIEIDPAMIDKRGLAGLTPLCLACGSVPVRCLACLGYHGKPEISMVKILLNAKANPNIPATEGSYPLHFAVKEGREDIIEKLLDYGADRDVKDTTLMTPLDLAERFYMYRQNSSNILNLLSQVQPIRG